MKIYSLFWPTATTAAFWMHATGTLLVPLIQRMSGLAQTHLASFLLDVNKTVTFYFAFQLLKTVWMLWSLTSLKIKV